MKRKRTVRLNENQRLCLVTMAEYLSECEEGHYMSFSPIIEKTRLDRKTVRRSIRALARKGYAEYANGLQDMDGEFRGAGYRPTEKGFILAKFPKEWK
jgi:DNA-binding MarR family transcriptional regulator